MRFAKGEWRNMPATSTITLVERILSGETIQMDIWSSIPFASGGPYVSIQARAHNDDGTDTSLGVTNTTHPGDYSMRSSATTAAPKNGFVTNLTIQVGGSGVARGRIWVRAYILDSSGARRGALAEGHLEDGADLGLGQLDHPGEGRGWIRTIDFNGNTFSSPVLAAYAPANTKWRVLNMNIQLYCGSTVASRQVHMSNYFGNVNGLGPSYIRFAPMTQPANSGFGYRVSGTATWISGHGVEAHMPAELTLVDDPSPPSGYSTALFSCVNFQSTDNWNPWVVCVEEWIVPD